MRLYESSPEVLERVPQLEAAKYENNAGRYWDLFYKRNADKFFKDRHYFDKEWPELTQGPLTVLEAGCGVGNTVFPLLEINAQAYVYACDFSPRAVQLVQAHPDYASSGRVTAFVADITQHEGAGALTQQLPGRCVDYCSMVFVLSAVAPQHMRQALRNVASVLKVGTGRVLFRDYAEGDLAQTRLDLSSCGVKNIRGNFYARGDGTCCYYFDEAQLAALFASEGFVCESSTVHARVIENRKSGVKMPRRWVQAVFRYDPDAAGQPMQQQQLAPGAASILGGASIPPVPAAVPAGHTGGNGLSNDQLATAVSTQGRSGSLASASLQCISSSGSGSGSAGGNDGGGTTSNGCGSAAAVQVSCARRTWLLPTQVCSHVDASSCSSSATNGGNSFGSSSLTEALTALVEQMRVVVPGCCVLILPPWLRLPDSAYDGASSGSSGGSSSGSGSRCPNSPGHAAQQHQKQALVGPAAPVLLPSICYWCSGSSRSSHESRSTGVATHLQQQGALAALSALVAVWLGARRVIVCLPGHMQDSCSGQNASAPAADAANAAAAAAAAAGSAVLPGAIQQALMQPQQVPHRPSQGPGAVYEAGVRATIALNECSVVAERIQQRRWQWDDRRHGAALQREVQRLFSPRDAAVPCKALLLLAQPAAAAGCRSNGCTACSMSDTSTAAAAAALPAEQRAVWEALCDLQPLLLPMPQPWRVRV